MPGSLNLEFAGPNVLKYVLLSGGDASRTQTQMIADCVPGPLKALLAGATHDALWQSLPLGPRLDLSIRCSAAQKVGAVFILVDPSNNGLFATSDSVGPASVVTVRFIPTPG